MNILLSILTNDYERLTLSLWLRTIKATVAGMTTINAPNPILKRKLVNEGVIIFNPVYLVYLVINYVVLRF